MFTILLKIFGFFVIGIIEIFITTMKSDLMSKGLLKRVALLSFFESIFAFFIIYEIYNDISVFVAYSMGASIGTYVNVLKNPPAV